MKRIIQTIVWCLLLGSLTIQADPIITWSWDDPLAYENGQPIPGGDLMSRTLHCGNNPADTSIPDGSDAFGNEGACADRYDASVIFTSQDPPSAEDMAFIVGGIPGTYYCASTVQSVTHLSTSGCSNEENFIVGPGGLGFVPNPPTLSLQ